MITPCKMSAKIISVRRAVSVLALVMMVAGCTPAGPRALLRGKKNLDAGDFAAAAAQLQAATTLLPTNAVAWNYYGVALQHAGSPDAAVAYQNALKFDRDLMEAHFNLGSLWLEQNRPDAAKTEFTAFTLRRPNALEGWLKLGAAQLKLGEATAAERSFATAYYLNTNNVEALNALGLARVQRGLPRDAAKFFAAAVQLQPDFAPAILNLATVNAQYLHDNKTALQHYRAWLALTPRPANWDEVNAVAAGLEQSLAGGTTKLPPLVASVVPVAVEAKLPAKTATTHSPVAPKPALVLKTVVSNPPPAHPATVASAIPTQVVQVAPEPQIVTTSNGKAAASPLFFTPVEETPAPEPAAKPGFWHRLIGSSKPDASAPNAPYLERGLTPLPTDTELAARAAAKSAVVAPVLVASFKRYSYRSPVAPVAGDRRAADGAFTKARLFELDEKWINAEQSYQQAAQIDPAWFEAQYNTGVLAQRLRNYPLALTSYEAALVITPDSVEARYHLALALKAAGYVPDAADELKKILVAHPAEVRAHLTLANLYAQTLRDAAAARSHYLKVLELEPSHPQASEIRFWLSANPN